MPVTINDIAKIADVSPATVSLVLNNKPGVGGVVRNKVLQIIKETGYVTGLSKGRSKKEHGCIRFIKYKKLGTIIDKSGFIGSISDEADIEARKLGYDILVTTVYPENCDSVFESIRNDPSQGIILLATELDYDDLDLLKGINVPVVLLDNLFEFCDFDSVSMNNSGAAYRAVEYLFSLGLTRIGLLKGSRVIDNFLQRREGYRKAIESLKLKCDPVLEFEMGSTPDGAYKSMAQLLKSSPLLPQAFFTENDSIAIGAIKALKEVGIKVPGDISVIGFDDSPLSTVIDPQLTTMRIFKEKMGQLAVRRLIDKIENNDSFVTKTLLNAELIVRDSTVKV